MMTAWDVIKLYKYVEGSFGLQFQQDHRGTVRQCQVSPRVRLRTPPSTQQLNVETNKIHDVFALDLNNLVQEIAVLKEKVKRNPNELKKFLVEKMRPLEDELMVGEDLQKQENKSAQEIMSEIKRENKETSEAIVKTFEKVHVGGGSLSTWRSRLASTTDTVQGGTTIYIFDGQDYRKLLPRD